MTKCLGWIYRSLIGRRAVSIALATALLGFVAGGCGEPSQEEPEPPLELGSTSSLLQSDEDFSLEGMGTNGLGTHGLSTSGLSISAMSSAAFVDWFNQDPPLANSVMKYVVACAAAKSDRRAWTNPTTGITYKWKGSLGLTPGWASGTPATEVEQQVITACLAAHTNKYGRKVLFSVQGLDGRGSPIPTSDLERIVFSESEACFFGNLFRDEGIFAGSASVLPPSHSSVRACGLEAESSAEDLCAPIHHVNRCSEICVPDPSNRYFLSCTSNGKSYRALATRIMPRDIYACGDGVCQISESCGTGLTPNNCSDCGPCP
ncbi:hypothetical protein [Hyalangium sp.]|uniref:hypothetical protein n=1 Tax=Hyalangium sp. TaxID=2028555 RepID=UPI002D4B618E|nr:hypothetical protein [Hyalangium sp.]HYH95528.1 hypothetical protein [Hyalangium sp.]